MACTRRPKVSATQNSIAAWESYGEGGGVVLQGLVVSDAYYNQWGKTAGGWEVLFTLYSACTRCSIRVQRYFNEL